MTHKHLVSGGCSFTTTQHGTTNWPLYLAEQLDLELHDCAFSGQGNGMIARRIIHTVAELLKSGVHCKEILVGIVWSGIDRREFFTTDSARIESACTQGDSWPTPLAAESNHGSWQMLNAVFPSDFAQNWYTQYHNETESAILFYERVHWTQCYLKSLGIDTFMSVYTNYVMDTEFDQNPNVTWIKDQIDRSVFLPVRSLYDTFEPEGDGSIYGVMHHPDAAQSENFAINHVLPFVKQKYGV